MLKKVLSNFSWLLFDRIFRAGLSLIVIGQVGRYLGVESFGLFNYVLSLIAIFSVLAYFGLPSVIMKCLVQDEYNENEILGTALAIRLSAAIFSMLFLYGVSISLGADSQTLTLIFLFSLKILFEVFDVIDSYNKAHVQSRISVVAKSISFLLVASVKVFLIVIKAELFYFILAEASEFLLISMFYLITYRSGQTSLLKWKFNSQLFRQIVKESLPIVLASSAAVIYMRIDQVMIRQMVGNEEVGIYAVAIRISELSNFIPLIIVESLFPHMIRKSNGATKEVGVFLQRNYNLLAILALIVSILVMLAGRYAIMIVFGDDFLMAQNILIIHIWTSLFVFLSVQTTKYLIVQNLQKITLSRTIIGALINIALNFLLIPILAGYGAALATLIAQAYVGLIANLLNHRTRNLFSMQLKAYMNMFLPSTYFHLYQYIKYNLK